MKCALPGGLTQVSLGIVMQRSLPLLFSMLKTSIVSAFAPSVFVGSAPSSSPSTSTFV